MKNKIHTGFTLIELLVVIVIIGILATISTATFSSYKSKANAAKSQVELDQRIKELRDKCMSVEKSEKCFESFVVYSKTSGSNRGIYQKYVGESGNGELILTGNYFDPKISPDGKYVLYINQSELYRVPLEGGTPEKLTSGVTVRTATYSSDGQSIVYVNAIVGNNLYKKDANTQDNGTPITSIGSFDPVFSPDGTTILYRSGNNLYEKNANDTNNGTPILTTGAYYPSFSPDGKKILYSTAVGTIMQKNADDALAGTAIGVTGAYPKYSPDGQYIFYGTSVQWSSDIIRIRADDVSESVLVSTEGGADMTVSPW